MGVVIAMPESELSAILLRNGRILSLTHMAIMCNMEINSFIYKQVAVGFSVYVIINPETLIFNLIHY